VTEKQPVYRDFLSLYGVFLLCYTLTHLRFEWNFWMGDDFAIFAKYAQGDSPEAHLAVAKLVYFSKATWMIVLVWLCALRVPFRRALALSFAYYAIALMFLFPVNVYTALNLLLAAGFALEEWRLARQRGGPAVVAGSSR